eukprot:31152-Chlamydomonas_euryale.AAC.7
MQIAAAPLVVQTTACRLLPPLLLCKPLHADCYRPSCCANHCMQIAATPPVVQTTARTTHPIVINTQVLNLQAWISEQSSSTATTVTTTITTMYDAPPPPPPAPGSGWCGRCARVWAASS